MIQRFVDRVQSWLRQWATEGRSPLHHRELYCARMPRCVEDAYTAVATYVAAGARTMASRVLDDRVKQLLQDQEAADGGSGSSSAMNLFDHVCRVHALLTCQAIRLFDGDVRIAGADPDAGGWVWGL